MKNICLIFALIMCASCKNTKDSNLITDAYQAEIDTYRNDLNTGRKNGYLQLTGLHKLDSLNNTFGQRNDNDFTFNVVDIPEKIGTIHIGKEDLSFTAEDDVIVTNKQDSIITSTNLTLDQYGSSIKMYYKHANWQVITRSGSKYLRVWDEKNPAIEAFTGFEFYPLNPDLIIDGQFEYYNNAKTESVKSQLGVNANTNFIGKVTFNYNNEEYSLDVGSNGFTMVGDATTGETTYSGGRYVYLELPETNGAVQLDFNRLYNPPCSFSKFTTCLYPPRQNHLPFEVLAGEKIKVN